MVLTRRRGARFAERSLLFVISFAVLSILSLLQLYLLASNNLVQRTLNSEIDLAPIISDARPYSHDNSNLVDIAECTNDQMQAISSQLQLEVGGGNAIHQETNCPNPTWLTDFYKEENDIGSSSFLGVSIGCNKGHDAIRAARMGMSTAEFDVNKWMDAVGIKGGFVCGTDDQPEIVFPNRMGEMHW
jgi:hypothetical protein